MKTILIIHGWPRPVDKDGPYYSYFNEWGYGVIAPEIFSTDFVLTSAEVKKFIEKQLSGEKPDVIMGVSLGGLIAPVVAQDYPDAKMILIATGPKFKPESTGFNIIVHLAKNKRLRNWLNLVKFLPTKILYRFYEIASPFRGSDGEKQIYMNDMKKNFKYILSIPIDEESRIIDFATTADNTQLLKNLKNRTLIFTGDRDILMPEFLSNELHNLLVNSQLVVNHGNHFDIISDASFEEMRKFLSD